MDKRRKEEDAREEYWREHCQGVSLTLGPAEPGGLPGPCHCQRGQSPN